MPGETYQLSLTGPRDGSVTWSSTRPEVATVVEVTGFVEAVAPGTTTVRAEAGGRSATADVEVVPPPMIGLGEPMVTFEAVRGEDDPEPQVVAVTNTGGKSLTGLSLGDPVDPTGASVAWMSARLDGSEAPTEIEITVSLAGLEAGLHVATLPVMAPGVTNSPQSLSIRLTVLEPPSIELSETSVQLGTEPDAASEPVVVDVTNGGDVPLTGLAASVTYPNGGPEGWLTATLAGSDTPTTLTLVASGAGLDEGTYDAVVVISAEEAAATLAVELTVSPGPLIQLSANSVAFQATEGGGAPAPVTLSIENGGGGELTDLAIDGIDYQGTGGWLSVALASTTAPTQVSFAADPDGMDEGTHTATVSISSPVAVEGPVEVEVTLTVDAAAAIALSTSSLTFGAARLGDDPDDQAVQITNAGGGTLDGLSATIDYTTGAPGWLEIALDGTVAPAVLTVQPRTGSLAVGTYTADVIVASSRPGVASRTVSVSFEVVLSFVADIQPIFETGYGGFGFTPCTNCHVGGGPAPRLDDAAAAYQDLVGAGRVVPGDPDASVLICKIKGLSGCGTAMPLPAAQIQLIEQWILDGARY